MMRLGYLFLELCLRQSGVILASGYSFRDSDCRDLFTEAWKRDQYRHLVVLDPRPAEVLARLGPEAHVTAVTGQFDPVNYSAVMTTLEAIPRIRI